MIPDGGDDMPDLSATMEAAFDRLNQPRDEGGKFASNEPQTPVDDDEHETPEAAKAEEPAATDEGDDPPQTQTETETEPTTPAEEAKALEPHPRWSEEKRAKFSTLPRDAQEFILASQKESDRAFAQKTTELAEERKSIQSLKQVFDPIRENLQRAGVSESEYVKTLVNADRALQENPAQAIAYLAKKAGLDLAKLAASPDQQQSQPDPVRNLHRELETFKQQIAREKQEAAHQRVVQDIESFANEKDSKGQPLRPHWADLESDLTVLVAGIRAQHPDMPHRDVLQRAYDQAMWANPTVRQKVLEAQEAEKKAAADAAARKAKGAASANVKGSGGAMKPKPRTIDQTMEETYDRMNGAA
ncbi:MAG: hypothetical protein VX464_11710 [Pseudomonadota bacterium]|nr:hypothetical protein [Pseudomonadota bacterium]